MIFTVLHFPVPIRFPVAPMKLSTPTGAYDATPWSSLAAIAVFACRVNIKSDTPSVTLTDIKGPGQNSLLSATSLCGETFIPPL